MTSEELNTKLYEKIFEEQKTYRAELLQLPLEQILDRAYTYLIREDILLSLEYNDLSDKQAEVLLKSEHPLADVFARWESSDTSHMETIQDVIECTANEKLRNKFLKSRAEAR